jgi:hypothetical protein
MSKKSMAARRQMQATKQSGKPGGGRQQGGSRGRGHRRNDRSGRRPWGLISAVVGVVVVFVVVLFFAESTLNSSLHQDTQVLPAPASLVKSITSIPLKTLEEVKGGSVDHSPLNIPSTYKPAALSQGGLPEVAYVGAEYCPYCALERWSLVIGLSHFGTWSNLHLIRSSVYEAAGASLPTFSFAHGAKFTSPYVAFVGREYQSNVSINHNGSPYKGLQSLPTAVASAFSSIGGGGYPFVDYAGKMAQVGSEVASVLPLHGLDWSQVAKDLKNPKSKVAREVLGGANYVTAATCILTGNKPGKVCGSSMIQKLAQKVESSQ